MRLRALELMAEGYSQKAAGEAVGVGRTTVQQ
jgi:DNA-binding XRE family transcriptional regulator